MEELDAGNSADQEARPRSSYSHFLPRLDHEFYKSDAVIFWTLTVSNRQKGWLNAGFHAAFREFMLHTAAKEALLCPAYCLMPDHIHLVWMGLKKTSDQRNGMKFLRASLGPLLKPARFQHQAHDHVLSAEQRRRSVFSVACTDYVLLNPLRAKLVEKPSDWPYLGALVPGHPRARPLTSDYWPWFWKHYFAVRDPNLQKRILPPKGMS
jgi:putative transposase